MIKKTLLILLILLLSLINFTSATHTHEGNHIVYINLTSFNAGKYGVYANGSLYNEEIIGTSEGKVYLTGIITIIGNNGANGYSPPNPGIDGILNITAEDIEIKDAIITITGGNGGDGSTPTNIATEGGAGGSAIFILNASHSLTLNNVTILLIGGKGGNAKTGSITDNCTSTSANGGAGGKTYYYIYDNTSNIDDVSMTFTNGDGGNGVIAYSTYGGDTCELSENTNGGQGGVSTLFWENIGNGTDDIYNFDTVMIPGDAGDNDAQCVTSCATGDTGTADDNTMGYVPLDANITFQFYDIKIINSTLSSTGAHPDDASVCCSRCGTGSTAYSVEEGQVGGNIYYNFYENYANITNFDVTLTAGEGSNAGAIKCNYLTSRASYGGNGGHIYADYYGYNESYSNERCEGILTATGGEGGNAASINSGDADGGDGGDVYTYFYNTINSYKSTFTTVGGISGNDVGDDGCKGGDVKFYTYDKTVFNDSDISLSGGGFGIGCSFSTTGGDTSFISYDDIDFYNTSLISIGFIGDESGNNILTTYGDFIADAGSSLVFVSDTSTSYGSFMLVSTGDLFELKYSQLISILNNNTLAIITSPEVIFKNSTVYLGTAPSNTLSITTTRLLLQNMDFTPVSALDTNVAISSPKIVANSTPGSLGDFTFDTSYTNVTYDNFWSTISKVDLIKKDNSGSAKFYASSNFSCSIGIDIDEEAMGPYYINITFYNGTTAKYTENEIGIPPLTTEYNYNSTIQVNGSHVGETWNCSVKLYSDFNKNSSDKEVIANRYPYNLKVYIGNSSDYSHNYNGELNSSWVLNLDRGELNHYIQSNCMTEGSCTIPIRFTSEEDSQINLSNIVIYTGVSNPTSGEITVPFNTTTTQNGNINFSDLRFIFGNLSGQNFRIRGFYNIGGTKYYFDDDLYASVLLSNFTISIIPKGMNEWYVSPKSATSKNVAPMGGNPFWNVTSHSTDNFSVYLRYNESLSNTCIKNRFVSNDYTIILNTTPQLFMNFTGINQVKNISTYTNFSCTGGGFVELPYFMFIKRCSGCVETDDAYTFGEIE